MGGLGAGAGARALMQQCSGLLSQPLGLDALSSQGWLRKLWNRTWVQARRLRSL